MLADAVALLRAEGRHAVGAERVPWGGLVAIVVACGALYGATMGTFGWESGGRERAVAYSAIKVPILLTFSLSTALPSFYVVNALLGLRADFAAAARGILSAQGTLAIALASLAPVTCFYAACGTSYRGAVFWNACAFGTALLCAQKTLARHYRPLVARDRRHRAALAAWFALYAFVAIKVGWVLRPFVGDPALPVTFLREGKWADNPYVNLFWNVAGMAWTIVRTVAGNG